ncbi:MAG: hypothetical protein HY764_04205 [Candidatus Portnoybacteria bacterium]|nr:hypothetical protein [Candidatus Portnoybacteria bacterium]
MTIALDIATIMYALAQLDDELGAVTWNSSNPQQEEFFKWLSQYRDCLKDIKGLEALASHFYKKLNEFLSERKFNPSVKPFDPTLGIGVVSVLDKLVKWLNGPGLIVEIPTVLGKKPGFELPPSGVKIYKVDAYSDMHLLELLTKSEDTLWIFAHDTTSSSEDGFIRSDLDLARLSMVVMDSPRRNLTRQFAGAKVPMIDFDVEADLSWIIGADTVAKKEAGMADEYWFISQAKQQFKMRMDEKGARVKVATALVGLRSFSRDPKPFVVDRPFYGWWTQKGIPLPMAAFYADWDAMKKPAGSLEDL